MKNPTRIARSRPAEALDDSGRGRQANASQGQPGRLNSSRRRKPRLTGKRVLGLRLIAAQLGEDLREQRKAGFRSLFVRYTRTERDLVRAAVQWIADLSEHKGLPADLSTSTATRAIAVHKDR